MAATAGRSYTVGSWYRSDTTVRAVGYAYSAGAGWRKWFDGSPYGQAAAWAPLATTTPPAPAGTSRISVEFPGATSVRDVSLVPALPRQTSTYRPGLTRKAGLVTNPYGGKNPKSKDAAYSPVWQVTAGSLFATGGGEGDTGKIDDGVPGPRSAINTGSAVFRMNTRRGDFQNVRVAFNLNIAHQTTTAYTPASSYDGVHIWLRHRSQYELYAASVTRRDGHVLIKKKCPGGPSNGGTYHVLGAEIPGLPVVTNRWQQVAASVQNNPGGSVTIVVSVRGKAIVSAVDTGVGCAPITTAEPVGIRGDNTRFRFTDFSVTGL